MRRELASSLLKMIRRGKLEQEIDTVPIKMFPREHAFYRCCIYKDRAMTRSRLLSLMGFDFEKEDDETSPLSTYARRAGEGNLEHVPPVLSSIPSACSSCTKSQYRVIELCRGCIARPCMTNCPKNAIDIINGKAVINTERCVNCGKCAQVCPFHAILYIPVPCEDACPAGAISRDAWGHVHIDDETCIYCGKCASACPFGAIVERSQILPVAKELLSKRPVTALIAPSIEGQFPGSLHQIISGLRKLGFFRVVEVAQGAQMTAELEAEELVHRLEHEPFMTTSCCSAFKASIEKHVPGLSGRVSGTRSPMALIAEAVKADHPEEFTVFIGPCIAKKHEGGEDSNVDAVLTFEELASFFVAWDVDVQKMPESKSMHKKLPRMFAVSGGVSASVSAEIGDDRKIRTMQIDGITRKTLNLMRSWQKKSPEAELIEGMCCENGCIGGPGCIVDVRLTSRLFSLEGPREKSTV